MAKSKVVRRSKAKQPVTPTLLSLPQEVLCMIAGFIPHSRDLSSLCRSCKAWRATILPTLFTDININAPHDAEKSDVLEHLLSSSGEGLKFTRSINIRTVQRPRRGGGGKDHDDSPDLFIQEFPEDAWSNTLNTLVRLLLMKVPHNTLERFTWTHNCELKKETIDILFTYQGHKLYHLELGPYHPKKDFLTDMPDTLAILCIPTLVSFEDFKLSFVPSLVADNNMSLRHLDLGVEMAIVKSYLAGEVCDPRSRTQLTKRMRNAITAGLIELVDSECLPNVQQLKFRGLDLGALTDGPNSPLVNWAALTHLTLESCCAFNAGLSIMAQWQFRSLRLLQIRHETCDGTFLSLLETFLCALPPLKSLFLLLEDNPRSIDLEPILKIHGESLRAFILEYRLGERLLFPHSRSTWSMDDTMRIFTYCPHLVELGMPLDWQHIQKASHHRKFCEDTKRFLPKLRTLNIRNMPETCNLVEFLTVTELVKGVALSFIEGVTNARSNHHSSPCQERSFLEPPSITVFALGALRYKDIWHGDTRESTTDLEDFITLRTYLVEYRRRLDGNWAPILTFGSKGSTRSLQDMGENITILQPYWLP